MTVFRSRATAAGAFPVALLGLPQYKLIAPQLYLSRTVNAALLFVACLRLFSTVTRRRRRCHHTSATTSTHDSYCTPVHIDQKRLCCINAAEPTPLYSVDSDYPKTTLSSLRSDCGSSGARSQVGNHCCDNSHRLLRLFRNYTPTASSPTRSQNARTSSHSPRKSKRLLRTLPYS